MRRELKLHENTHRSTPSEFIQPPSFIVYAGILKNLWINSMEPISIHCKNEFLILMRQLYTNGAIYKLLHMLNDYWIVMLLYLTLLRMTGTVSNWMELKNILMEVCFA